MIHLQRRYNVRDVSTPEELADELDGTTWCLCTGFRLEGFLFLNDSFSEDSAQEYAVIEFGRQVESITFSWCDRSQALTHIKDVLAGQHVDQGSVSPRLDHGKSCALCR